MEITKKARFEAAHRIFGHPGGCGRLHGHSYVVEVTVQAQQLCALGMVRDFSAVKGAIVENIIAQHDHAVALNEADPLLPLLQEAGQRVVLYKGNPTAENMAQRFAEALTAVGFDVVRVKVWETADSTAVYEVSQCCTK